MISFLTGYSITDQIEVKVYLIPHMAWKTVVSALAKFSLKITANWRFWLCTLGETAATTKKRIAHSCGKKRATTSRDIKCNWAMYMCNICTAEILLTRMTRECNLQVQTPRHFLQWEEADLPAPRNPLSSTWKKNVGRRQDADQGPFSGNVSFHSGRQSVTHNSRVREGRFSNKEQSRANVQRKQSSLFHHRFCEINFSQQIHFPITHLSTIRLQNGSQKFYRLLSFLSGQTDLRAGQVYNTNCIMTKVCDPLMGGSMRSPLHNPSQTNTPPGVNEVTRDVYTQTRT